MRIRSKTITITTILHILCSCHGYTKSEKGKHATTIMEQHVNGSNNVLAKVVFYNRVSKAGSGTLIEILHLLSSRNGFTLARDGGIKWGRELLMLSYEEQVSIFQYSGIPNFKLL